MDLAKIPGASELQDWFESWPSFHDAEILDLHLDRKGPSTLRIHAWKYESSADNTEIPVSRRFIARFIFDDITNLDVEEFNHQNVIYGLSLQQIGTDWRLELKHCWGLSGFIQARRLRIEFEPGSSE